MARNYTQTKRAEHQAETRTRIVEAALDLHTEIGPARTTVSMIAERAGVQRHTVYAHFPDDRSMLMACSGLHLERDPLPDPAEWSALNDPASRLRAALTSLYGWYGRNAQINAQVLRDAEYHALTRDIMTTRFGPVFGAIHASLSSGLAANRLPALALAMSFYTWRTLVEESRLTTEAAVELMAGTVLAG